MSHDLYEEDSRFLSPSSSSPRKSPSKQTLTRNRSNASLRGGTSSLAHELAVALLPEPTAGSKLLAEEFGIEYDEGAEGIDGMPPEDGVPTFAVTDNLDPTMEPDGPSGSTTPGMTDDDLDPSFSTPPRTRARSRAHPEPDAMALLSQNLESTDKFLAHLQRLDADGASAAALEGLAAGIISRLNETARDREEQVRELLRCEREFQRIAGEVGGTDALAALDALDDFGLLVDIPAPASAHAPATSHERRTLEAVTEEASFLGDWEVDPDAAHGPDGDESDADPDAGSPLKDAFAVPPPPAPVGPATPAAAVPQLAHLRTHTASLAASLTAISEHAQVNGAATTEAGRKIRALKNKLGGWRTDWDSAERSRVRIERWEAGGAAGARRVDGRAVVAEHLREFERVLSEANTKTQAIMAAS
ncbi:hypothetical protein BC834DRAFT_908971 [Gloeopeniophorella convolvens]|nr:hypothetical protein BC834DRAFT_908971 [Gloeopeniophorella convolvens]